jgi:putative transposase
MPAGLERRYGGGSSHFVTCSCYHRLPLLNDDRMKHLFLTILEEVRRHYEFRVFGYVIMPEHFHLLLSEPEVGDPSTVLQVLKQRVAHRALQIIDPTLSHRQRGDGAPVAYALPASEKSPLTKPAQFWQRRFYDFNVWNEKKRIEKLCYMHRNPVKRGLAQRPEDWPWSSFRHYAFGEIGPVEVESEWTARRREREVHVLVPPS